MAAANSATLPWRRIILFGIWRSFTASLFLVMVAQNWTMVAMGIVFGAYSALDLVRGYHEGYCLGSISVLAGDLESTLSDLGLKNVEARCVRGKRPQNEKDWS